MFQLFEITVSFSLGKREENPAKGGIDDFGREHGNKSTKTVEM